MRVAIVSKFPPAAEGVSEYGYHVARVLAKRPEVDGVTILANRITTADEDRPAGLDLRRIWQADDPALAPRLLRQIRATRPDVVWFNLSLASFGQSAFALGGFLTPLLVRRAGIRSIVTVHELPTEPLSELGLPEGRARQVGLALAIRLLLGSDVVCVTIDGFRRGLIQSWGADPDRVVHLPLCGYDEPTLEAFPATPSVLMLTSHAPHKNLTLLVDAFRQVRQTVPMARLLVAGIDHPRFPGYLRRIQQALGDAPGVSWLGPIPGEELRQVFRAATVVVAPYRVATGSSATIHRAVSLGRPVVATDLPAFRAMAQEEDLWLEFFPRDDGRRLADVLTRLLVDRARGERIARHNHASALRHSLTATTDAYLRIFRRPAGFAASTAPSRSASGAPWP